MTFKEDLLNGYLASIATLAPNSLYYRGSYISQFLFFLQKRKIRIYNVGRQELALFAQYKIQSGCKRSTIKLYLLYIIYFYRYLAEETGYSFSITFSLERLALMEKYYSGFKVPKGEQKTALSPEEVDQLMAATTHNPSLKMATWTMLNFGLRLQELISINIQDIDLKEDLLHIHQSKGQKTRRIPIFPYQRKVLQQWLRLRKKFLPLNSTNESFLILKSTEKRPSGKWLQQTFLRLSHQLGFKIHAHRLRRTFASILYFDFNIDIADISFALGHANLQTTYLYLGIKESQKIHSYREALKNKIIVTMGSITSE